MSDDRLEQWRGSMTDADVVERASAELSRLCKGGGWRMSIPVNLDYDSDLILSEAIQRLKGRAVAPPGGEPVALKAMAAHVWGMITTAHRVGAAPPPDEDWPLWRDEMRKLAALARGVGPLPAPRDEHIEYLARIIRIGLRPTDDESHRALDELETVALGASRSGPEPREDTVTRVEVIDHRTGAEPFGRVFSAWNCRVEVQRQDGGRTLKVFVDGEAPPTATVPTCPRGATPPSEAP